MPNSDFKVGAHVSIAGGIFKAPKRVRDIRGNSLQIFSSSPRTWKGPDVNEEDVKKFKRECKKNEVIKVFIHAKYLISLGSKNKRIEENSIRSLKEDLELAERIEAEGVVFHPRGEVFNKLAGNTKKILDHTSSNLIIENTAQKRIEEVAKIFKEVKSGRLKFCLDTAHTFEAGHDLSSEEKVEELLEIVEKEIGENKLIIIHSNDSKTKLGSKNDKHANIGRGRMGENPFFWLLHHPKTKDLPFILEVPALKNGREGSAVNIKLLRELRNKS